MQQFFTTIKSADRVLGLTAAEKSAMDQAVLSFVNANPLSERTVVESKPIFAWNFSFATKKFAYAFVALLLCVTLTTSTALAAENSLPGDLLYGVKVNINEHVIDALQFSPEDKASWAAEKIDRRLNEAEDLIDRDGEIDQETAAMLQQSIDTYVEEYQTNSAVMRGAGESDAVYSVREKLRTVTQGTSDKILDSIDNNLSATNKDSLRYILNSLANIQTDVTAEEAKTYYEEKSAQNVGVELGNIHVGITGGDTLQSGIDQTVFWDNPPLAASYQVMLLNSAGGIFGEIVGHEATRAPVGTTPPKSLRWNVKYVYDITKFTEQILVPPGEYVIEVEVKNTDNNRYTGRSPKFKIISPAPSVLAPTAAPITSVEVSPVQTVTPPTLKFDSIMQASLVNNLPTLINAAYDGNKKILVGTVRITSQVPAMLESFKATCTGDYRAMSGIVFDTNNFTHGDVRSEPTTGGFILQTNFFNFPLEISANEPTIVVIGAYIADPKLDGMPNITYPVKINCQLSNISFTNQNNGSPILMGNITNTSNIKYFETLIVNEP